MRDAKAIESQEKEGEGEGVQAGRIGYPRSRSSLLQDDASSGLRSVAATRSEEASFLLLLYDAERKICEEEKKMLTELVFFRLHEIKNLKNKMESENSGG